MILGNFVLTDYTISEGLWRVHFINSDPGGGNPSDYYVEFSVAEVPTNISQTTLANILKTRLAQKLNQTYAPLNTAITNGMTITLP